MPYTQEQIDAMFAELPSDVKDAMSSVDTVHVMADIQKKYNLHIDQAGELSTDAALLMVGAIKPQEFIGQIESQAHIPRETAKQIAAEVNEKIFRPVRESLMQIHKMKEMAEETNPKADGATAIAPGEISEEQDIKNNAKNKEEETEPVRTEGKNITENKLSEPFSMPKKTSAPDPYREAVENL
jgi:restriction endonuclease